MILNVLTDNADLTANSSRDMSLNTIDVKYPFDLSSDILHLDPHSADSPMRKILPGEFEKFPGMELALHYQRPRFDKRQLLSALSAKYVFFT